MLLCSHMLAVLMFMWTLGCPHFFPQKSPGENMLIPTPVSQSGTIKNRKCGVVRTKREPMRSKNGKDDSNRLAKDGQVARVVSSRGSPCRWVPIPSETILQTCARTFVASTASSHIPPPYSCQPLIDGSRQLCCHVCVMKTETNKGLMMTKPATKVGRSK